MRLALACVGILRCHLWPVAGNAMLRYGAAGKMYVSRMEVAHPGSKCPVGCSAADRNSLFLFSYDAPVITLVLPTNSPSRGGTVATLLGINLGTPATISAKVGSTVCAETRRASCTLHRPIGRGREGAFRKGRGLRGCEVLVATAGNGATRRSGQELRE